MGWTTLFGAGARRTAPGRRARLALAGACAAVLVACVWLGRSLLGSSSPEATLVGAYRFLDQPPRLDRALDASWRFAVREGGGMARRADDLLAPPLPPFLCAAGWPGAGADEARELDRVIRQAEQAAAVNGRTGLANAVEALENRIPGLSARLRPIALYALARAASAGGDWAGASRALERIALVQPQGGPLPTLRSSDAARAAHAGSAPRTQVTLAFHARYLAGMAAHGQGRPVDAVAHFRRALNAVSYALDGSRGARPRGHHRRTDLRPGALSCSGAAQPGLTSLDAYAGLVAAYMAAPDFRDPERLAGEVARRRLDMDPGDPLAPVLRHARQAASQPRPQQGQVPEHVLWAASNLQRVYHYNRLRPDPRLAASRAVLTWRVLDEPEWTRAMGLDEEEQCDMLAGVAAGLRRDGATNGEPTGGRAAADSAWAAVAVHTFARLEARCPDRAAEPVAKAVRERWLERSGGFLHGGLVVLYERRRRRLEAGVGAGGSGSAGLSSGPDEQVGAILDDARSHARTFCGGAVPADLNAGIEPEAACAFISEWTEAVFHDVAEQLVEQLRRGAALSRIRARDASDYVRTTEAAVAHAGLRPSDVYRAEDVAPLVRSRSGVRAISRRLRHHARNQPAAAVAALLICAAAGTSLAVLAFVNWWRFFLLTRTDFYADEAAERMRRRGDEAPSP